MCEGQMKWNSFIRVKTNLRNISAKIKPWNIVVRIVY